MTDQNEKATAKDEMFHQTTPSPEAQAIIGKLEYAYETFGMSIIMTKLPSMKEMLGGVTHAIANQRIAPEYNKLLMDVGMFLFINAKMHDNLVSAIETGQADGIPVGVHRIERDERGAFKEIGEQVTQAVIPTEAPKPWCENCQKHHDIYTQPAAGIAIGLVTDQAHGNRHMMIQMIVGNTHDSPGLHVVIGAAETKMLAENLMKCAEQLEKEQPKAS